MAFQARGPRNAPMAAKALTVRIDAPLGLIRSTKATATAASSAEIAAPYTMVDQLSMVMPPAQDSAPMMLRTIPTARAPMVWRADQPRPRMSQQASAMTATASI